MTASIKRIILFFCVVTSIGVFTTSCSRVNSQSQELNNVFSNSCRNSVMNFPADVSSIYLQAAYNLHFFQCNVSSYMTSQDSDRVMIIAALTAHFVAHECPHFPGTPLSPKNPLDLRDYAKNYPIEFTKCYKWFGYVALEITS